VNYLLDCDFLLALGYAGHVNHDRASLFYAKHVGDARFYTTAITELAFVRIGTNAGYFSNLHAARSALHGLILSSKGRIGFLADDVSVSKLPAYVTKAKDTTDGHLLSLAQKHGLSFVTLDVGIPGALVIK
jgi:predicted nucleic acid-binding protein